MVAKLNFKSRQILLLQEKEVEWKMSLRTLFVQIFFQDSALNSLNFEVFVWGECKCCCCQWQVCHWCLGIIFNNIGDGQFIYLKHSVFCFGTFRIIVPQCKNLKIKVVGQKRFGGAPCCPYNKEEKFFSVKYSEVTSFVWNFLVFDLHFKKVFIVS